MLNPLERRAAVEQFLNNQSDEDWTRLRNVLFEDMPLRVIVTIDGGNYRGAVATGPVEIEVLDYDNWRACDEGHKEEAEYYAKLETEVERLKDDPSSVLL